LRFLLDTNVLSEPTKPKPNPIVLGRIREYRDQLATASVVWHELLFGLGRLPESRRRQHLERYLTETVEPSLPILAYDAQAASWHAEQRVRLAREGRTPPFADGQIAAIAAVNGLVLITRNVKDFAIFEAVQVENWSEP
jgi:tRNA(fMet)-specific endonuclease VapC